MNLKHSADSVCAGALGGYQRQNSSLKAVDSMRDELLGVADVRMVNVDETLDDDFGRVGFVVLEIKETVRMRPFVVFK